MLQRCAMVLVVFGGALVLTVATAQAVSIVTVPVGDAGNAADSTGYGAVAYNYQMGKYDITNAQYCQFLNAKASTGDPYWLTDPVTSNTNYAECGIVGSGTGPFTFSVKPGMENQPVVDVTWFDAVRFANWLTNGQGDGDTETGAYTITANSSGGGWTVAIPDAAQRAAWAAGGKIHYLLPSEDEWYKAAYYKGGGASAGYWLYPTQSDTVPTWTRSTSGGPNGGTNSGNFYDKTNGFAVTGSTNFDTNQNYLTDVGAYAQSLSAYGTLDQGGNVMQWNDTLVTGTSQGQGGVNQPPNTTPAYGTLGGDFSPCCSAASMASTAVTSSWGTSATANYVLVDLGFRVASVGTVEPGDANGDGRADINDLSIVLANYGKSGMIWSQGDFNNDGKVDVNDLSIILAHYNQTAGASVAGLAAVPEPSCLVLAGLGVIGLLGFACRRRRA